MVPNFTLDTLVTIAGAIILTAIGVGYFKSRFDNNVKNVILLSDRVATINDDINDALDKEIEKIKTSINIEFTTLRNTIKNDRDEMHSIIREIHSRIEDSNSRNNDNVAKVYSNTEKRLNVVASNQEKTESRIHQRLDSIRKTVAKVDNRVLKIKYKKKK